MLQVIARFQKQKKADLVTKDNTRRWKVFSALNNQWEYWNGTTWEAIGSGSTIAIPANQLAFGNATGDGLDTSDQVRAYGSGSLTVDDGADQKAWMYFNRFEMRNLNDYGQFHYNRMRFYNTTDGSIDIQPSAGYTNGVTLFYPPLTAK